MGDDTFEVCVGTDDLKFNCAHFIAFSGFRERMHGHNYRCSIKLSGNKIGGDGYLIDFGDIKSAAKFICGSLNELFICPMLSDVIIFTESAHQIELVCEDSSLFLLPRKDCVLLPIRHSS